MGRWPIDLWNEWAIQILVLLSFTLQLVLLLWLAYQFADSTAIYALGHLSLSNAPRDHHLVAFWAPFLLLHLGGPDNITAYAVEDNQLWKRHLLTLIVQVLGAMYVLYKHIASSIMLAAVLMLVAGVLKYGERTWALKCGNLESIRSSLRKEPPARHYVYPEFNNVDLSQSQVFGEDLHEEEELLLRRAHSVFHICQRAVVDSSVDVDPDSSDSRLLKYEWKTMWRLVEMQLSLLYDILYTKAVVIHTLRGYFIRAFTLVATSSSFLLFWFSTKHGQNRVDVGITYALLAGAFFLELTSLLGALGSSWTLTFLYATRWRWLQHAILCSGRWDHFRSMVVSLRQLFNLGTSRRWSGKMGQYNMLRLCSRSTSDPIGRLMQMLDLDEWWNKKHYSGRVEISEHVKKLLHEHARKRGSDNVNTVGVVRKRWGKEALEKHESLKWYLGAELMEGILMWHIATDLFLIKRKARKGGQMEEDNKTVRAVEAISNYMMFLPVNHPYMLPGLSLNRLYQLTCEDMAKVWRMRDKSRSTPAEVVDRTHGNASRGLLKRLFNLHDNNADREELGRVLYKSTSSDIPFSHKNPRLPLAITLAHKLVDMKDEDNPLQVVLNVWVEILFYAAKKLSSGSELTTILWLMAENFHHYLQKYYVAVASK